MKEIRSRDNPTFKHLLQLSENARYRRKTSASLMDGEHLIEAACEAHFPLRRLIVAESRPADDAWLSGLRNRLIVDDVLQLPDKLFSALSSVATPTGVLAEFVVQDCEPDYAERGDVLALAGVQDAGNLGTMLRTAAAAGIQQVWLDNNCAHAWSPKALRAGMGAHFGLHIAEGLDLQPLLANSTKQVAVTSLGTQSVSLFKADLLPPMVWVFGSEGQGVPSDLIECSSLRITIPMPGAVESLNVAAAAAICIFEQLRQRQATTCR